MIDTLRALTVAANSLRFNPEIDPDAAGRYEKVLTNLRDKLGRDMGSNPLTLDELREMDGEAVWIEKLTGYGVSEYGIVHLCPPPDLSDPQVIRVLNGVTGVEQVIPYPKAKKGQKYGKTWLAYRRKPEKGEERQWQKYC